MKKKLVFLDILKQLLKMKVLPMCPYKNCYRKCTTHFKEYHHTTMLDLLPLDIENIIMDYKQHMEIVEKKEKVFEEINLITYSTDTSHYMINHRFSMIYTYIIYESGNLKFSSSYHSFSTSRELLITKFEIGSTGTISERRLPL